MLECAFPRRLRNLAAALWLCGAALAGFTAPLAFVRTGVISSLPFLFALALLVVLAVETFQGARLALVASIALLGGQLLGIVSPLATDARGLSKGGPTAVARRRSNRGAMAESDLLRYRVWGLHAPSCELVPMPPARPEVGLPYRYDMGAVWRSSVFTEPCTTSLYESRINFMNSKSRSRAASSAASWSRVS